MSRIAIIGAGRVGRTLARGLRHADHHVHIGSRDPGGLDEPNADTVAAALHHAEIVINATPGHVSAEVFAEHADLLDGIVLIDVANSHNLPAAGAPSIAEQVQQVAPRARVVKALNTMAAPVMIAPHSLPHPPLAFLAGNDADAKNTVGALLRTLGWDERQLLDLGDLGAARALEAMFSVVPHVFRATGPQPLALTVIAPNLP